MKSLPVYYADIPPVSINKDITQAKTQPSEKVTNPPVSNSDNDKTHKWLELGKSCLSTDIGNSPSTESCKHKRLYI